MVTPERHATRATVGTHEVWMLDVARTHVPPELEAPDVVAQIGA